MMARTCKELDTADGCSILLPVERPLKNENGLKKTEKKASSGGSSSLASCNNKEPAFTLITKFAAQDCSLFEPKFKWMPLFILLGILFSGANGQGVDVQREVFRSITIATSETEVVTYPVPTPVDGSNFLIYARDGNNPGISYQCTSEFVAVNQSCSIFVGDEDKTECKGLQMLRNVTHTWLAVNESMLTHDCTVVCILQQFPGLHSLYPLVVVKEHDQDIDECASSPCGNGGTCVDGLDSITCNCARGYGGANCEIDIDECASSPCVNGGTCVDGLDSITCNCAKGYDGTNCEIDINECVSNPCQNGGACVDGLDSYTCNCAKGYNGDNCEIAPETNHYKVAFFILLSIVLLILLVIAIVIKKNFPCIPAWLKKISMERVPTKDPDQDQNTTVLHDLDTTI